jgi:hypothetical protein
MAELLIMAQDPPIPHPRAFTKGMVVDIKDDGHKWGTEEKPPLFRVIKVPGVPKEDLQFLLDSPEDLDPSVVETLPPRLKKLDWDSIKYISSISKSSLVSKVMDV